jgi:hypothetical protein
VISIRVQQKAFSILSELFCLQLDRPKTGFPPTASHRFHSPSNNKQHSPHLTLYELYQSTSQPTQIKNNNATATWFQKEEKRQSAQASKHICISSQCQVQKDREDIEFAQCGCL